MPQGEEGRARGRRNRLSLPAPIEKAKPEIEFAVSGSPLPQGSKTGYIRGGCVVLVDVSDKKTTTRPAGSLKRWKQRIAEKAEKAMTGDLWTGPIELECTFVIPRSVSHWTSKGALRKGAPTIPSKDLDKLIRAVGDSLSKVVYIDDVQIISFGKSTKRFSTTPTAVGGVFVRVREL